MTGKILFDVSVGPNATEWYGQLIVEKIHYEDGSLVTIHKYLGIRFKSPAAVSATDVQSLTNPWTEISPETSNEQIDATTYQVVAKLAVGDKYTINQGDTQFRFGINGDLTKDPSKWTESFKLAADSLPDAAT